MRFNSLSLRPFAFAAVIGLAAMAQQASAEQYIMNFETLITGDMPDGSLFATLTITDLGSGDVEFVLEHNATSAANQFISDLWFNMDPFQTPTRSGENPSDMFMGGLIASENGIVNAGHTFDLNQMFETSNTGNRLDPGESATFILSGTGLTAADFISNALGGDGNVIAMIHVQGLANEGSGKLAATELFPPVPEPASMAALSIGVLALIRRRKAQKG